MGKGEQMLKRSILRIVAISLLVIAIITSVAWFKTEVAAFEPLSEVFTSVAALCILITKQRSE